MERLTVKYDDEWLLEITEEWKKEDLIWSDYCKKYAIPKLAEYENTGLEPSEVEQLKVNQNKLAVEKLEIVKVKLNEFKVDNFSDAYIVIKDMNFNISTMLAELKGEKDE